MGEKSRWYSNLEVKKAISEQMQNREAIWMQVAPSRDKPFWVRKSRAESPQSVQYWLDSLGYQYNGVGAFIGTNLIDWEQVDILPPSLRTKGFHRRSYSDIWKEYLIPSKCNDRGLVWSDIWIGKTLLFDFDSPKNPLWAFERADKVATHLTSEYGAECFVVFSGSKGFHVHVGLEDSRRLVGIDWEDYQDHKDPLKVIGQAHADKVVELASEAGVNYTTEDRSSNFRQGIVRCPYSIHPKTGQIVWPLDMKSIEKLRSKDNLTIEGVAKTIHRWDIPNQSTIAELEYTYITPEFKVKDRGMPRFVA